jgi:hypothetical protein
MHVRQVMLSGMSDPYDLYLPPQVQPDKAPKCLEVRRGPAPGRWTDRARVRDTFAAQRLLARWRKAHPEDVVVIFVDGAPIEDQARREKRLFRERVAREASYLAAFAEESEAEGHPEDAEQYRRSAEPLRKVLHSEGASHLG